MMHRNDFLEKHPKLNRITKRREANIDRMRRRIAVRRDVQEWSAFWLVSRDPQPPTPTAGDPVPGGVR